MKKKIDKRLMKVMSVMMLLTTSSAIAQSTSTAILTASLSEGHGAGNNGGLELSFQSVRVQTLDWLERNLNNKTLTEKLALKVITAEELFSKYRDAYNIVNIKVLKESELTSLCEKNKDALICGLKNNKRVVCKNESEPARILCVDERLSALPGDEQFSINFHEHLGVAGIEINDESADYSRYPISSRLMKFANPVVTTRWELGDLNKDNLCDLYTDGISVNEIEDENPWLKNKEKYIILDDTYDLQLSEKDKFNQLLKTKKGKLVYEVKIQTNKYLTENFKPFYLICKDYMDCYSDENSSKNYQIKMRTVKYNSKRFLHVNKECQKLY